MSKKTPNQNAAPPVGNDLIPDETAILEAEAYNMPTPDAGADVTMFGTVGSGGPVPIIAPKHNTIQLQPIVVPLAVVPYMSQDSSVLRTDGRQAAGNGDEFDEAAEFENAGAADGKKKKKKAVAERLLSAVTLLLGIGMFLPFIISFLMENTIKDGDPRGIGEFNIIRMIMNWADKSVQFNFVAHINYILYIVAAAMAAVIIVCALIGLIVGRYPRPLVCITSCIGFLSVLVVLILGCVNKEVKFDANSRLTLVIMVALTGLIFVTSVLFSVILNKIEDEQDKKPDGGDI